MGQNESNPVRNMDKRTARREYRDDFMEAISSYRQKIRNINENNINKDITNDWLTGLIRVCIRKRPIFKDELIHYEFDVITCINDDIVVVHDARMHSDMKRQFINHYKYKFDRVFNERCNNDEVYLESAEPMTKFAVEGGFATCLMYGQTGSGKTYTMSSIYERAARDIFQKISGGNYSVSISFCEIAGDNCFDLLNSFHPVQLLTGKDGGVYAFPIVEPEVISDEQLLAFIKFGCNVRTTAATGVHDASSRSHALLRIYILNTDTSVEGVLTLVDLAGSEHRIDSMYHNAERRKEGAAINSSLMALKECIRAKASNKDLNHYYRKSKLTMALKASFSNDFVSRTTVIVTISPASKDTEHSLNSLRHAHIMDGGNNDPTTSLTTNKKSNPSQNTENNINSSDETAQLETEWIGEINTTAIAKRNRVNKEELKTDNGNVFQTNAGHEDKVLTENEKIKMRRAAERNALKLLTQDVKIILKESRQQLGGVRRQQLRLSRLSAQQLNEQENNDEDENQNNLIQIIDNKQNYHNYNDRNDVNERNNNNYHNNNNNVNEDINRNENLQKDSVKKDRPSANKLRMSIYGSEDGVPNEIKRRQYAALLKQKGYNKSEVESIIQKEIEREQLEHQQSHQPQNQNQQRFQQNQRNERGFNQKNIPRQDKELVQGVQDMKLYHSNSNNSIQNHINQDNLSLPISNRIETLSAGSSRTNNIDQNVPMSAPSQAPAMSRHEAAKLRRLQIEAEKAQKKSGNISKPQPIVPSSTTNQDPTSAISLLEMELQDPNLTSAAKHGIMKRISTLRSALIREERWKEQEKREAEKRAQQVKLAAAAEEAKRRLGIPSNGVQQLSPSSMKNTTQIESVLSPRIPKTTPRRDENNFTRPPSSHQNVNNRTPSSIENIRPSSRGRIEVRRIEDRDDSLDRHIQSNEYHHVEKIRENDIPQPRIRNRGNYHGASSAPFANDMNWDR